jgi:probable HAF family extracellular repeat protein
MLLAGRLGQVDASATYNVVDLGSLGGSSAQAKAVNAAGAVVGLANVTGNAAYHAALWTNSSSAAIDLGTLGGSHSQANGINSGDQIVGWSYVTNDTALHAVVWTNSSSAPIDLGTLGGASSQANAVNDSGQIVGFAHTTGDVASHASLWTNSSNPAIDLGTLGGTVSQASAINGSGQIVGTAYTASNYPQAVLWTNSNSAAIDLGALGGNSSQAYGINAAGQIVGYGATTSNAAYHAAFWTNRNSTAIDLGTLGGTYSQANAINDSGQIVGAADTTSNLTPHAILWTNSSSPAVDLNTLIPAGSGWLLSYPYAINDSGEIVGYGTVSNGDTHAFVLIPIPPNTSTNTWISPLSGKWETSTNWSNGSAPSLADSADAITNATSTIVTIDSVTTNTPGVMVISNLIVSAPLGSTNTLFLNDAGAAVPLQILDAVTIGSGGVLTVSGSSLMAGSVNNAGLIQAAGGTLEFFGLNIGTNDVLSGAVSLTNGAALLLSGTDSWTLVSAIAYGGGASGGSIIASDGGTIQAVFLSNPSFCNNAGTLAVVGGSIINYGQIGADLTNNYVITGSGSLTGGFGLNSYGILNQGTIATISGGTLVLDTRDALDFGGVQNLSNIVVASASVLSIRRSEDAWDNPATVYPTNSGTIFMQGGVLRADDATTLSTNRLFVNGVSGLIEGCGTFTNWTTVINNGLILANCGTTLTFSGAITNNGTMRAANSNVLEAYGTVVNNGTIDIINGGVTKFHGGFINNGTVLTAGNVAISSIFLVGNNVSLQIQSAPGHLYELQVGTSFDPANWISTGAVQSGSGNTLTFTDLGGATNAPARFYRVLVTSP